MEERKLFKYPPFFRIIDLSIRHKDKFVASDAADLLAKMLKNIFGNNVLGPEFPLVSRINNYFIKNIIIKFDKNKSSKQAKSLISLQVENIKKIEKFKYINIIFDVDPM
jgi:primosomal protein N' (replication factor Y)